MSNFNMPPIPDCQPEYEEVATYAEARSEHSTEITITPLPYKELDPIGFKIEKSSANLPPSPRHQ